MPAALDLARDMARPAVRSMLLGSTALTRFGVNGVEAALALDFIGGEYRTGNTATTFADAFTGTSPKLTYSTAAGSNSTMTQGYGPELVENGGFDTDTDWTKGTGWTISGGVATHVAGSSSNLDQNIALVTGAAYEIQLTLSNVSAGAAQVYLQGSAAENVSASLNSNGSYVFTLVAGTASSYDLRVNGSSTFNGTIDNVSVREAPKIVWAPHNLIRYSEDLSGSYWTYTNLVDPVQQSDTVLTPDGSGYAYYIEENTSGGIHYMRDEFGPLLNATWTASVYIKQKDVGVYVQLRPFGVGTGLAYATFSAADGTLYGSGGTELVSAVDGVAVGDGWFKVSMTCTASLLDSNDGLELTLTNGSVAERPSYTGTGKGVYIWGAHVYRSDLGGMAQVPGADTGFETYVPTNGSAEYLPRVGHHVYNGSTWVNEGLLIESEPRTNLVTESATLSNWDGLNAQANSGVASVSLPDGSTGGVSVSRSSPSNMYKTGLSVSASSAYTASIFVKADVASSIKFGLEGTGFSNGGVHTFDLSNGSVNTLSNWTASIDAAGNDWWRLSVSATTSSGATSVTLNLGAVTDNQVFYAWGAQLEAASTPSSYMPTSGGTYTRTAQSLTVPPAEFGWPEPEYIGSELVDEASDLFSSNYPSSWTIGVGSASVDGTQAGVDFLQIKPDGSFLPVGVYVLSFDVTSGPTTYGIYSNSVGGYITSGLSVGSHSVVVTQSSVSELKFVVGPAEVASFDNISVREINPLAVSIQMDGRMTYADEGSYSTVFPVRWYANASDYIYLTIDTFDAMTGRLKVHYPGTSVASSNTAYTPGVLTPFNIASRHGSTFVNGAVDGTALTADTTPTELPDLSGTNLQIAYDFMGTIGTFRQFAGDIGDTGLVTATNPSTEPTLSLTFDGTAGGSYYNLSWSE